MRMNGFSRGVVLAALAAGASLGGALHPAIAAAPKYYFELHKVEADIPVNPDLREFAGEALKADLAARPGWRSELGVGTDRAAIASALKSKKLSGFELILRFIKVKKEVKQPALGSRLNQLSVTVGLAILGTAIPGEKMAFSGEGEAGAEAGVPAGHEEAEADAMFREAIKTAIGQAIDQAVLKLTMPKSAPMNESRRKRK